MRVAYIANYQGPALAKRRPILRNLSLAARVKTERIAELLVGRSHEVEIISQGEVIEKRFKLHPGFIDPEPFHKDIPVYYASALPVRMINALWSTITTLKILKSRQRTSPFDIILINNLKPPQVICASYGKLRWGLPVVLQYEDGAFGMGKGSGNSAKKSKTSKFYLMAASWLLPRVSACMAVSPDLLSQTPEGIPKFLLRGVVGDEIAAACQRASVPRKNWVVFSGTHFRAYGLLQLIAAWKMVDAPGWQLHIAGQGDLTEALHKMAADSPGIVFHGLLNRKQNAEFLAQAKIGINPHDTGHTTGNVFAFKIIEYLAAGTHVVTTPMGTLQQELEPGVTYMKDNSPETIAATLQWVIQSSAYEHTAAEGALKHYGAAAVAQALDGLLRTAVSGGQKASSTPRLTQVVSSDEPPQPTGR